MPRLSALALVVVLAACAPTGVQTNPGHESENALVTAAPSSLTAGARVADFFLDSQWADGASSPIALEAGRDYVVRVTGTYSGWSPDLWGTEYSGGTESTAMFPSPGTDGPVGLDAAHQFAAPSREARRYRRSASWVQPRSGWTYRLGETESWTEAPLQETYRPDHVYEYRVRGLGQPLQVRAADGGATFADNYGRFQFEVFEAVLEDPVDQATP